MKWGITMQRGFTLVELIAVIMIIGILLILVIPKTIEVIQNSKSKSYDAQISKIEDAAALYMTDNSYIVTFNNNVAQITLKQLVSGGYIDPVTNPKTGENFNQNSTVITITKSDKKYSYNVVLNVTTDSSGASVPELASNMIPIYYDATCNSNVGCWKKADETNLNSTYKWYDYTTKKWANAVTVSAATLSTYKNAALGTQIVEADILTYMVWVPRYSYYITTSGTATSSSIQIKFETASTTKSTGNAISTYKTHPAFTFGGKELNGIWVGKFETSVDSSSACYTTPNDVNCNSTAQSLKIKYGVYSWRYAQISTFFTAIRNMELSNNIYGYIATEVDTHMMKNSEWGATAYLAYSVYGKNSEVWINSNSSYVTGQSGATVDAATGTTYAYNTTNGVNASTTGNIYGIYDMSGGAWEYVMGNYNNYSGASSALNSGFSGPNNDGTTTIGLVFPISKYYDVYTSTVVASACNNGICYGQALSETPGWNNDTAVFVSNAIPWLARGGLYSHTTVAGIFHANYGYGNTYGTVSTRVVVTIE